MQLSGDERQTIIGAINNIFDAANILEEVSNTCDKSCSDYFLQLVRKLDNLANDITETCDIDI